MCVYDRIGSSNCGRKEKTESGTLCISETNATSLFDIFSKSLVTISEELEAVYQLCCVYVIGKLFGLCETITHLLNYDESLFVSY